MKVRTRRYVRRPPDLTSLFDVLFIVVFVALIRAAAAQSLAAQPPSKPVTPQPPAPPPEIAELRTQALANLEKDLEGRTPVVLRVSAEGAITSLEIGGDTRPLDVPLLEQSTDPDAAIAYLGDRSSELRVCRIAAVHLGVADLSKWLVIISPAVALADLKRALVRGLQEDMLRCAEQHGIATIVDPTSVKP